MKKKPTALTLLCFLFSIPLFADTVYVKIPKADAGITDEQKNSVRDAVKQVLKDHGDKVAAKPADAKTALLATVHKNDEGYTVEVQKFSNKKAGAQNEASNVDLFEATLQATLDLLGHTKTAPNDHVVAKSLPQKTAHTTTSSESPEEVTSAPVPAPVNTGPDFIKHWYVALGPNVTNNLVGQNGTKYTIALGYNQGLNEHIDLLYFYDGNFNTGSQGSTTLSSIGVAGRYLSASRTSEHSPFFRLDASYGGGNKANDAGLIGGLAVGYDFFRQGNMNFEVMVRQMAMLMTGATSISAWPSATQVMIGVYF